MFQFFVQSRKAPLCSVLVTKGLDDLLSVVHFLNVSIELTQQLLLFFIMSAARFHHTCRTEQRKRHHDDWNDSQFRADCQHHQKDADCSDYLRNNGSKVLADGTIDGIDIVGNHTKNIAVGMCVVVIQFQSVHFPVNVASDFAHDIGSDLRHVESLQKRKELGNQI